MTTPGTRTSTVFGGVRTISAITSVDACSGHSGPFRATHVVLAVARLAGPSHTWLPSTTQSLVTVTAGASSGRWNSTASGLPWGMTDGVRSRHISAVAGTVRSFTP